VAALAGALFGLGLVLGGMTDPRVVQGFLDPFGAWDPRLAFVMAGGLIVSALGVWLAKRRGTPFLADHLQLPTRRNLDAHLVAGAVMFGAGWGLAGYCPGPALTSALIYPTDALVFLPALLAGSWAARLWMRA